jgi:hypothetical protein
VLCGGVAMSLIVGWLALVWMLSGAMILLWALGSGARTQASPHPQGGLPGILAVVLATLVVGMGLAALLVRGGLSQAFLGRADSGISLIEPLLQHAPGLIALALALVVSLFAIFSERSR